MSERGKTWLDGHHLWFEGAAHDLNGRTIPRHHPNGVVGCGKCTCGALSDLLPSKNARKRWHREHKDAIREGRA